MTRPKYNPDKTCKAKLKEATDILREIKLNVERDPNYYIDVDSTLMEDITNLLSDE